MMSFLDFKKKNRWPRNKSAEDVYDSNVDQVMHHLNQIRLLTHKDAIVHRAGDKLGVDTSHLHDIHGHVTHLLKKHGS